MTAYNWRWTAPIKRNTLPVLREMAAALGFIVTGSNAFTGQPAAADMLDALALAYRADPAAVIRAMQSIGVVNVTPPADVE